MLKITRLLILFTTLIPFVSKAQIQFSPYIAITTGSWPEVVAIGDVNNDGLKDVVMGTKTYGTNPNNYKILVFIQNASGNLNTPIPYPYSSFSSGISSIDIADLNHDGKNDVVIGFDSKIGIYFQNASGTLDSVFEINPNFVVATLKTADLNNDGLTDFAVGSGNGTANKIYYQNSNNIFTEITYTKPDNAMVELEIADINNDGRNDLVFLSTSNYNIYVYYQNTSGTFNPSTPYYVYDINAIGIGDLNNDSKNDVVAAKGGNSPSAKVAMLLQSPTTHLLTTPTEISAYDIPEAIEVADLNNDGKNEIIAAHGGWMKVTVYQQNSSNTYSTYSPYNIPYASHYNNQGMAIGDINNDNKKDIAIADYNNGLVVLYNISTLNVNDNTIKANVLVYPNPTTNYLNIENKMDSELSYEITDTNGKLLQSNDLNAASSINISELKTGLYFLILKSDREKAIYKFIKD